MQRNQKIIIMSKIKHTDDVMRWTFLYPIEIAVLWHFMCDGMYDGFSYFMLVIAAILLVCYWNPWRLKKVREYKDFIRKGIKEYDEWYERTGMKLSVFPYQCQCRSRNYNTMLKEVNSHFPHAYRVEHTNDKWWLITIYYDRNGKPVDPHELGDPGY